MARPCTHTPKNSWWRPPGRRTVIKLAVFALVCCASARALDPSLEISQYAHTSWKVRDGFTKGIILSAAQGPDGYLWLGTEFGLLRFDGVRAIPWQPPPGQQLPSAISGPLLFSRDGTLWLGMTNGLASWKDGKLTIYREVSGLDITLLIQDSEDTIWAVGNRSSEGTTICSFRHAGMECQGVAGSRGDPLYGLYEDSKSNLWVGTHNGFWRWKPGPPKFFPAQADVFGVVAFGEDDQHTLLVALKGGMHRFVNGQIEREPLPYPELSKSVIRIFRDRDGGLWFATLDHGLIHLHQGKAETFSSTDGLSGDSVLYISEDREGNVWVTTSSGLDEFRSYSVPTISHKQGLSNLLGLSAMAATDGRVWITSLSGLDIWDHGKLSPFRPSNRVSNFDASSGGAVPNFPFEDSNGRIWVSFGSELGYLDHDRFVTVSGYPGGVVRAIVEGPPGHLWVTSPKFGIFEVFHDKVVEQLSWRELGLEHYALSLAADHAGNGLWIGLWKRGIAYLAAGKIQASYSSAEGLGQGNVNDLHVDSRGVLWAATDGGLSRIKDGRISTLTSRNGLPCDTVYWSIEDEDHAIWLYMPCGLVRVARNQLDAWENGTKSTIEVRVLDVSDGVGTPSLASMFGGSGPLVTRGRDGKIWFVTSDGVSTVDPHHLRLNSVVPPVHIQRIVANGKPYSVVTGLRLDPLVHYLTIDFTALSFAVPEKVRFRYMLESVDPGWREVINDRKVQYSNLSPGHYRFRVIAANNSGVWNEQGDTLEFEVLPAWYQTLWFRILCAAAFFMLLWWAYLLRVRHLRNQEKKLRDVVETIPSFVWTADPDGSVDFANHHWVEFSGLSAEESVDAGWLQALHPEDRSRHEQKWSASVTSGEPFEIEVRFRGVNGEYRWFLIRAVPMRDSHGQITKWYGTTTDIEDRKHAEEALRRSETYLADGQKLSHTGSWAVRPFESRAHHCSEELFRLWGLEPEKPLPDWRASMDRIHPDDRDRMRQSIEYLFGGHVTADAEGEYRLLSPGGTVKYIHSRVHPVFDDAGHVVEYIGTEVDITEHKQSELDRERLRRLESDLAHVNRVSTMGELMASISHELKQPITASAINASAALLWLQHDPPDLNAVSESTSKIIKSSKLAGAIIDRLRTFYKKTLPKREPIILNEVIGEMIEMLRTEAARNRVSIQVHLASSIPFVNADRVQIQQVLMNLMLNGIEAMKETGGVLTVKSQPHDGHVDVSVSDTGVGLPPENEEQIFEAFFTTKPQGTGMGLAIGRSIIESHGGRIWAEDNNGRGATFNFTLPTSVAGSENSDA